MNQFTKNDRLLKKADFNVTMNSGTKIVNRYLVALGRNCPEKARIGLVVSRRVGNAVTRNRIKRCLREAFRHDKVGIANLDTVFIVRHTAAHASRLEVISAFRYCVRMLQRQLT